MSSVSLDATSSLQIKRGQSSGYKGNNTGRRIGARPAPPGKLAQPLDLGRTVNAALLRQAANGSLDKKLSLAETDLHVQIRNQDPKRLVIFLIDTSDSMGDGPTARISAALGASMTLAARSYLSRDQVCLITFRDHEAQLVVPPTNSVSRLKHQLKTLPVGGATPLSAGLQKAQNVIRQVRAKSPLTTPLLVLLSDGEATSPLVKGADPKTEALRLAKEIAEKKIPVLVIDTQEDYRNSFMRQLAENMQSPCHHILNLKAGNIVDLIDTNEMSHD